MLRKQWGIRVGAPVKSEKGFITVPLGMWALWATIAMGWAMILDMAYRQATAPEHWF
jgi:hypothetical protein